MSIPNLRAIRDWCKERFRDIEGSLTINGERVYLDCQDGKYGCNTDPERGADTFTPFKSGDGEGGSGGGLQSPLTFEVKTPSYSYFGYEKSFNIYFYLPIQNAKRLVLKSLNLTAKKLLSTLPNKSIYFKISGFKKGSTSSVDIKSYNVYMNSTSYVSTNSSDEELDISEYNTVYCILTQYSTNITNSSPNNYSEIILDAKFELYF